MPREQKVSDGRQKNTISFQHLCRLYLLLMTWKAAYRSNVQLLKVCCHWCRIFWWCLCPHVAALLSLHIITVNTTLRHPGRLRDWPYNQGRWKTWQATTLNPHINSLKLLATADIEKCWIEALVNDHHLDILFSFSSWWEWVELSWALLERPQACVGQGWRNVFKTEKENDKGERSLSLWHRSKYLCSEEVRFYRIWHAEIMS